MDFNDTETQALLRDTADRLIRDKYEFETRKTYLASPEGYSASLWKEYGELGLLGIDASEDHGGSGGDFSDLAVVLQAFGRGLAVEPYLSSIVLSAAALRASGDQAAQDEYLPKLATGEMKIALAHGEPGSRYSLAYCETSARADGDAYILNGQKAVVLGADDADMLIVSARTSGATGDAEGVSLFLVPRGAQGLTVRSITNMDDRRAGEVTLENVRAQAMLGAAGAALPVLEAAVDRATAAVCCEAVGAMEAVNQLTLEYLKTRNQFGRPIGKFQVLQHRMADMVMAEQSARSMMSLAIANVDNPDPKERARAMSAAKVQIGKSGNIVGRGAIQLHGGIGMTMEYVAGHYFRRLTSIEKMFGDTDYHLARFSNLG
ncbi:MAG: acyl-CoA dehydrogenase family protein [Hyphomicrobiales bacterium]|nr:acyl-CoA dehydrogenase family protein [Hyphomicrobiales bacterium]